MTDVQSASGAEPSVLQSVEPDMAFFLSLSMGDGGGLAFGIDGREVSVLRVLPGTPDDAPLPVVGKCSVEHLAYLARTIVDATKDLAPPGLLDSPGFSDSFLRALPGHVLAPVEPTRAMRLAANEVAIERDVADKGPIEFRITGHEAEDVWNAMLKAALKT
jgi:hypothetical protein